MGLKDLNLDVKYVISMERFLSNYYGVTDLKMLLFLSSLTHSDLKEDELIKTTCVPFDSILKMDIYTGEVILVRDTNGNIAPYKNPLRYGYIQEKKEELVEEKIVKKEKVKKEKYIDLTKLSYSTLLKLKEEHEADALYSAILHEIYKRVGSNDNHSQTREIKTRQKIKSKAKKARKIPYMYAKSYK